MIGQPLLFEQHRTAVVQLNGNGGQQYQKDHRKNKVEDTLSQPLFKCQPIVPAQQQRRIKQPDLLCPSQDNIRNFRGNIRPHILGEAIFDKIVPQLSGNFTEDNTLVPCNCLLNLLRRCVGTDGFTDHILVHAAAHFQHQLRGIPVAVDDYQLSRRVQPET